VKEHGASDGRYFSQEWTSVIIHRPSCDNIHDKNERVSLAWLHQVAHSYMKFIQSL
jgi:acetylornithine deacetylase/succinyl-diaminopimelate desuccinylase-like protein